MVIIPIDNNSKFSESIELDGVVYTLKFHWNNALSVWYMDIYKDTELIISSVSLVCGILLLKNYNLSEISGDFLVVDRENLCTTRINMSELGNRYNLVYFTEGEINNGV